MHERQVLLASAALAVTIVSSSASAALRSTPASAPATDTAILIQSAALSKPLQGTYYLQPETGKYVFQTLGTGSVTIGFVRLTQAVDGLSISSTTCVNGLVLQGNVTCEVDLLQSAIAPSSKETSIEIETSQTTSQFYVNTYVGPIPLAAAPTVIDFGHQLVGGQKVDRRVAFTNLNPFNVDFPLPLNLTVSGPDAADFALDFTTMNATCGVPLTGFNVCWLDYSFLPSKIGVESASVQITTGHETDGVTPITTTVSLSGTGVAGAAVTTPVDLKPLFNVFAIGEPQEPPIAGGLDGLGYALDGSSLPNPVTWGANSFALGPVGVADAVTGATVAIPPGQYGQLYLLATGVRGDQPRHPFVATYSDGTSDTFTASFSDWAHGANHANEVLAAASYGRIDYTGEGVDSSFGPYRIYGYTLAVDRTKVLTGLKFPQSRNVVTFALSASSSPVVPIAVDLSAYFNVVAVGEGPPIRGPGIDGQGNSIAISQLHLNPVVADLLFAQEHNQVIGPERVPDAVSGATIALPSSTFSAIRLLGMAVNASHTGQTLVVTYADGSSKTFTQDFSDWHYSQGFANEVAAIVMPYRANPQGERQTGRYQIYQYMLPIDPTKVVASLQLPQNRNIVIVSMSMLP